MSRHVTMTDVARRAQVHQTTVSLALRNDPRLSPATRKRIQSLAEEMHYRPNPLVSALISERRKNLSFGRGCVLAFLSACPRPGEWRQSRMYEQIFLSMREHASSQGYSLEEFWLREPGMTPARMRDILLHRGIRGIVICPLQGEVDRLDFDFSEFSPVALSYTLKTPAMDHVAPDYSSNMSLAIRHFLDAGYRRIQFFTTACTNQRVNHLSLGCYLAERRLNPKRMLAPQVFPHLEEAAILRQSAKSRPDAILISTSVEQKLIASWMGDKFPIASLDCYPDATDRGIVRSVSEEARSAISLVTSRVERADFGLPRQPRSILVPGTWRGEVSPARKVEGPIRRVTRTTKTGAHVPKG